MHYFPNIASAALSYPAIDNHAHPLLAKDNRNAFPLQGIVSESTGDVVRDTRHTLTGHRAIAQLAKFLDLGSNTWDALEHYRNDTDYLELCRRCFKSTGIQSILLDDGLSGVAQLAERYDWHDQLTTSPCKRIVRIEPEAERILAELLDDLDEFQASTSVVFAVDVLKHLSETFKAVITASAKDDRVAGFKSVICYRTGLDIASSSTSDEIEDAVLNLMSQYKSSGSLRLQQKALNDYLVRIVLEIADQYQKPVQFHTGLGDNDIRLKKSSPAYMQPIVEAYPNTPIVLLHASYPFTREAGYLTSVYDNVYLDIGEVFPLLSGGGQRAVILQVLELAPTNKVLWSTDGRWWPESYYLASIQSRQGLCQVLSECVYREELTEEQAIEIVQNVLFHNANKLYNLGLEPNLNIL